MIPPAALWAKLKRDTAGQVIGWHSLVGDSADVAAVVEALLLQPTVRRRLATAAGRTDLDEITRTRLSALSFLHDIGKANRGFRARVDLQAPPRAHRPVGLGFLWQWSGGCVSANHDITRRSGTRGGLS
jgi:hypothetical protein